MLSYIFLLTFAVAIPGTMTFLTISCIIKEQVEHSVVETLGQAQERFTSLMGDVESILFIVHADERIHQILENTQPQNEANAMRDMDELGSRLLSADRFKRKTSNISLYAVNKDLYSNFSKHGYSDVYSARDFESQPWYKETLQRDGEIYWQFVNGDNNEYRPLISASMVIRSFVYNTRKLGVIRADINLRYFLDDLEKIKFGETGGILLVCDKKIVNRGSNALIKGIEDEFAFYDTIYGSTNGSTYKKLTNGEHLIAFEEIQKSGWKLVAVVPTKELLRKVDIIGMSIFLTCILCLIIAFVFSLLLSHIISKPIRHLAKVMKKFESDLNTRIETHSNGEVGFLYKSFNNMAGKINVLINDIEEISQKEKNAELKALQAQINPHFLYNTLDSINWLALKNNAPDISHMITSLGTFLRHSLNKGREFISIENELEQVQSYINIQKVRYKGKFDVHFNVEQELYNLKIIKLVLQPIVENAIIHGFKDIEYMGEIVIKGYREDGYFYLKVLDNGIGADIDRLNQMLLQKIECEETSNKSYGIRNVNERLKLYYGEQSGISFEENEYGGVNAIIKVRLDTSSV